MSTIHRAGDFSFRQPCAEDVASPNVRRAAHRFAIRPEREGESTFEHGIRAERSEQGA
jgi:hypothetical protein